MHKPLPIGVLVLVALTLFAPSTPARPDTIDERVALKARTDSLSNLLLPQVADVWGFPPPKPVKIEAKTKAELREADTRTALYRGIERGLQCLIPAASDAWKQFHILRSP